MAYDNVMIAHSDFQSGLPYSEFFTVHGSPGERANWDKYREAIELTGEQKKLLGTFVRRIDVLMLAGTWCGDCAFHCPILERFGEAAPLIHIRYVDRDVRADLQKELQINGGNRVPVAVFFSEDGHEVARFGERTLSEYRRMVRSFVPEGILPPAGNRVADAVADWLEVVERVQWILRLSPRLRKLHGD
jgi:thiol-disulfide isomerase/thioredoxin